MDESGVNAPQQGQPLRAHSFTEVQYFLVATPCCACGQGPLEAMTPAPPPGEQVTLIARCSQCTQECRYELVVQQEMPATGAEAFAINVTQEPSRIVDLGQWVGLFYRLIEAGARATQRSESRRLGYQAALCLHEALKFYGDNEVPPLAAFFNNPKPCTEHLESFARQRLMDMLAKLPALPRMARQIEKDEAESSRRWWQLWRSKE